MLKEKDLLAKVKELGDVSKSELVRSCGYVSSKKDGTERLNFTAFYEALLEAKGMPTRAYAARKSQQAAQGLQKATANAGVCHYFAAQQSCPFSGNCKFKCYQ